MFSFFNRNKKITSRVICLGIGYGLGSSTMYYSLALNPQNNFFDVLRGRNKDRESSPQFNQSNHQNVTLKGVSAGRDVAVSQLQYTIQHQVYEAGKKIQKEKEAQDLDENGLRHKILDEESELKNTKNSKRDENYFNLGKYYYFLHRQTNNIDDLITGKNYLDKVNPTTLEERSRSHFLNIKGIIYQGLSELHNNDEENATIALQSYKDSLKLAEEFYEKAKRGVDAQDKNSKSYKEIFPHLQSLYQEIARLKNNIGNIYVYLKANPKKGGKYIKQAIEIEEEIGGHLKSQNFLWNLRDAMSGYELELFYGQEEPADKEIEDGKLYLYLADNVLRYAARNRCGKIDRIDINNLQGIIFEAIKKVLQDSTKKSQLSDGEKEAIYNVTLKKGYNPYLESNKNEWVKILNDRYDKYETYLFGENKLANDIRSCIKLHSGDLASLGEKDKIDERRKLCGFIKR